MKDKNKTITFADVIIVIVIILFFSMILIQYYKSARALVFDEKKPDHNFTRYANFSDLELEYSSLNISPVLNNRYSTSVVVINQHGIFANENRTSGISYIKFKDNMFALKKAGYETINMEDLYLFMKGEKQIPEKSFMITFDDGIKDSYYNADPILKVLNYTAVIFVITSHLEINNSPYYLNKEELHQMEDTGRWEIGSHSYAGHGKILSNEQGDTGFFFSNKKWNINESRLETDQEYINRIKNDLQISKELLEKEFNNTVIGFALPFGEFGQRDTNYIESEQSIMEMGKSLYPMIFYQFKPSWDKDFRANFQDPNKDFFLIMRLPSDTIPTNQLINEVEAAQSLDLPYIEKFDNPIRWIYTYNRGFRNSENELKITNEHNVSGEMTYLDGSYLWKDYIYSGIIGENGSDKILILSRFQDSRNYVACRYTNKSVYILNIKNGILTEKDQNLRMNFPGFNPLQNHTKLSISTVGQTVGCYINDILTVSQNFNDIPLNGGIGLRVEGLPSNKNVTFASIRVDSQN